MTYRKTSNPTSSAVRAYSSHGAPRYRSSSSSKQLQPHVSLSFPPNHTKPGKKPEQNATDQTTQPTPKSLIRCKSCLRSRHTPLRPFTGPFRRTFFPGQDDKYRFPSNAGLRWCWWCSDERESSVGRGSDFDRLSSHGGVGTDVDTISGAGLAEHRQFRRALTCVKKSASR